MLALMVFTACENAHKDIDITLQTNHSELVAAIENMDKSLSEKLLLIQSAVTGGFADEAAAQELLRQAVAALSGTLEEKLSALEAAVQNKTATLELKLGLIEAAINQGFADAKAQQALLQSTLASLSGTLEEKLSAVEASMKSQTLSLETKLALIETALKENLSDGESGQEMMVTALETLTGTLEERLKAIETAVGSQASGLSAKLGLIEAALDKGLADKADALALIQKAVEALEGTVEEKLSAIETAVNNQTASLEDKLGLIEAAAKVGFAGIVEQQNLLNKAVDALKGTAEARLAAIQEALGSQGTTLSSKLALIETALRKGLATREEKQGLIRQALAALEGTLDEKLAAVDTAMLNLTDSLTTKLGLIVEELDEGMADEAKALGQLKTAVTTLAATFDDPEAAYSVAAAIDSISTRLSAEGAIGKALSDLLTATQGLNYTEALKKLEQAIKDLANYLKYRGHEYVDLGLPSGLKWATCNVGATKPEDYGDYFAWGETEPYYKEGHSQDNPCSEWREGKSAGYEFDSYSFCVRSSDNYHLMTKYCNDYLFGYNGFTDTKITLDADDDAACFQWGGSWRMPTMEDWQELMDNCFCEWLTGIDGIISGLKVTSLKEGYKDRFIFLPAAGARYDTSLDNESPKNCCYWSSSYCTDAPAVPAAIDPLNAYGFTKLFIEFQDANATSWTSWPYRCYGRSVRPVSE